MILWIIRLLLVSKTEYVNHRIGMGYGVSKDTG
jgi:hypothetical protein